MPGFPEGGRAERICFMSIKNGGNEEKDMIGGMGRSLDFINKLVNALRGFGYDRIEAQGILSRAKESDLRIIMKILASKEMPDFRLVKATSPSIAEGLNLRKLCIKKELLEYILKFPELFYSKEEGYIPTVKLHKEVYFDQDRNMVGDMLLEGVRKIGLEYIPLTHILSMWEEQRQYLPATGEFLIAHDPIEFGPTRSAISITFVRGGFDPNYRFPPRDMISFVETTDSIPKNIEYIIFKKGKNLWPKTIVM